LIAGTKYRGEFEQRIKSLLKEIQKSKGHYILFIDELHTVMGAGADRRIYRCFQFIKNQLWRKA